MLFVGKARNTPDCQLALLGARLGNYLATNLPPQISETFYELLSSLEFLELG